MSAERAFVAFKPTTSYACEVFGKGLWSCPADCPNLRSDARLGFEEDSMRCKILATDTEYTEPELIEIGVTIRQPGQELFKSLQFFVDDGKMDK